MLKGELMRSCHPQLARGKGLREAQEVANEEDDRGRGQGAWK